MVDPDERIDRLMERLWRQNNPEGDFQAFQESLLFGDNSRRIPTGIINAAQRTGG